MLVKMRNIPPRAGLEPTSLAFQASVLTIMSYLFHDIITLSTRIYVDPCLRGQCRRLCSSYWNWNSFKQLTSIICHSACNYIYIDIYIYIYMRSWIMDDPTTIQSIMLRAANPHFWHFLVSVLNISHLCFLMPSPYLRSHVYETPFQIAHCRILHKAISPNLVLCSSGLFTLHYKSPITENISDVQGLNRTIPFSLFMYIYIYIYM